MKVAIHSIFPQCFMKGGAEMQAIETAAALRKLGIHAEFLRLDQDGTHPDILHLFQDSHAHKPVIEFAHHDLPVVLSSITPGVDRYGLHGVLWRTAEIMTRVARTRTCYGVYQDVVDRANRIVVLHNSQKQFYVRNYRVAPAKIVIIPNGVREEFFLSENAYREEVVSFLGAIIPRKNPVLLAKALIKKGIKGVFAGAPHPGYESYYKYFEKTIKESGGLLDYVGKVPYGSNIHIQLLRRSKVFCLPSFSEVQSLAALEALASGCEVILAEREYANNEPFLDCIKVNPKDVDSVAQGIVRALSLKRNRSLDKTIFSWTAVAESLSKVYRSCANEREREG